MGRKAEAFAPGHITGFFVIRDEFDEVEIDTGHTLKVTRHVQECDAIITVPVLKTHGGTIVTLGMKNLKGLLHGKSKQYCHHPDDLLDHFIACIAEKFTPSLTLIDGIYAQEQGPQHMGFAHRWDLLLASTDLYAADLLGAHILGYGTDDVKYLNEWAEKHGRSKSVKDLDVKGDVDPDEVRRQLRPETILLSVMAANNETGAIQPLEEISGIVREQGLLLHTDAVQAVGKMAVDTTCVPPLPGSGAVPGL